MAVRRKKSISDIREQLDRIARRNFGVYGSFEVGGRNDLTQYRNPKYQHTKALFDKAQSIADKYEGNILKSRDFQNYRANNGYMPAMYKTASYQGLAVG